MTRIEPIIFPITGTATKLSVLVLNFLTDAVTATTYYQLLTDDGVQCLQGNYQLTEEEFAAWGQDNSYIDDIVASHLPGVVIINEEI
jgi:hypothetical protein